MLDQHDSETLNKLPKIIQTESAELSLEFTYVWFSVPFHLILGRWQDCLIQLPALETKGTNAVTTFQTSLEDFAKVSQKDQDVTVCSEPCCDLSEYLLSDSLPSHISLASCTCQASSKSKGLLALTHLFQHDCWVSKEDILDMSEVFPPWVSSTLSYISHSFLLCCNILYLPNFSFFLGISTSSV